MEPTPNELAQAHVAARLRGTLAEALESPLLARCLVLTAEALTTQRGAPYRPLPAAPPHGRVAQQPPIHTSPRRDFKRASAADSEE